MGLPRRIHFFDAEGNPGEHETFVPAYIDFCSNNDIGMLAKDRPSSVWNLKKCVIFHFGLR